MKKRKNEENDNVIPFCRFFDDIFRSSFDFHSFFFFFEGGEYLEYLVIDEENGENDVIFFLHLMIFFDRLLLFTLFLEKNIWSIW